MGIKISKNKIAASLLAVMLAGVLLPPSGAPETAQAASSSQLRSRLSELKTARAEANAGGK